ncbi:uncharacterized protein LOC130501307, partial [Raphanus sativus]|uniref:Uncharacterized protein LOC130501307 n=1 Tax=Raphanus sativus TaxID=3726 RepID=A0A9W3CKN0_RAPSA
MAGTEMSRDECVKFLRDKGSEFVGLDHLAEALFCFRKSLTLSEEGLGDDAILSASIKLVSCLVAKLYLETEKDKRTVMIEEGLMIINQTKNLGRTSVDYDSVAKMYCALGDSAYIKGDVDLSLKIYTEALLFLETDPVADLMSRPVLTKHHAFMNFAISLCLEHASMYAEAQKHCQTSVAKSGVLLNMKDTAEEIKLLYLGGLEKMEVAEVEGC